jgi:diguanylate cyclase (GGDEF)-like protein/PAS domain S-box-containing protein
MLSTQKHEQIIAQLPNILLVADNNLIIQEANKAIQTLGYGKDELVGASLKELFANIEREIFFKQLLTKKVVKNFEMDALAASGARCPVLLNASILEGEAGQPPLIICVLQDISDRKKVELELTRLARYDFLTSLPNRMQFMEVIEREIARCQRTKSGFGLILLDLDKFKEVNDKHGHPIGDRLLQEVAVRLRASIRGSDFVARLGGDEFVIIITDVVKTVDLETVAHYLQSRLNNVFLLDELEVLSGSSMGILTYPEAGQNVEELLKHADIALYRAKEAGRNSYQFY